MCGLPAGRAGFYSRAGLTFMAIIPSYCIFCQSSRFPSGADAELECLNHFLESPSVKMVPDQADGWVRFSCSAFMPVTASCENEAIFVAMQGRPPGMQLRTLDLASLPREDAPPNELQARPSVLQT